MSNIVRCCLAATAVCGAIWLAPPAWALPPPAVLSGPPALEHDDHGEAPYIAQGTAADSCVEGVSGGFPCRNIELLSRITLEEFGAASGSDSWGWKDASTGRYYALMGLDNGVSFVEVTDPENPVIIGHLPSTGGMKR